MLACKFASSVRTLVRGASTLVVVSPASALGKGGLPPSVLGRRLHKLLLELVAETPPGARGASRSTLAGPGKQGPKWLYAAVLPDTLSRYNSPTRADSIRHAMQGVGTGKAGKAAVLLVLDDPAHYRAAANAVARAWPAYSAKSSPSKAKAEIGAVTRDGKFVTADALVQATVECSRDAASLVDTPPTVLNPQEFAARARAMLKGRGVKVTEIKGDALLSKGLRGIHSVGRSAQAQPRLVIAQYAPKGRKKGLHVALVGKGVTFDTGGLHIKGRAGMNGMKADMGGASAVLGAFRVLVETGCPHRVTLLLCLAENAIDSASYKPDDILELHSGKTVEINNTDAEGRLLLADGVSWAARVIKADVVIDAATLTGAQLISTGTVHAAIVTDDPGIETLAIEAGQRSGDLVHPLPFAPELYAHEFKSRVADMRNSVADRMNAQSACAAQFVYSHYAGAPGSKRRRFCHIDLAGPAFPKDRATGYGVALISELVASL